MLFIEFSSHRFFLHQEEVINCAPVTQKVICENKVAWIVSMGQIVVLPTLTIRALHQPRKVSIVSFSQPVVLIRRSPRTDQSEPERYSMEVPVIALFPILKQLFLDLPVFLCRHEVSFLRTR